MKDIVFDLGGVLIDWNPRYLYKKIFASEEEMEWFLNNICTTQWNTQQDAGRPFEEGIALLQEKYPKYSAQIESFFTRWEEMNGAPFKGSIAVLKELKEKGYKVYALTNWSSQTMPRAKEMYPFFSWFDGMIVSGEVKLVKPDPKIYEYLLKTYDLHAGNCLFIDDNAANVAEASFLGFDALAFTTPEELRAQLVRRGIL